MAKASCDSCVYNVYDEDDETYYCEVDMDEDDAARLMQGHYRESQSSLRFCRPERYRRASCRSR